VELHSVPRRVRPENTKGPLHTTTLTVGEQISYAPGQNLFGYKIHEPAKTLSWQSDVLFFSGEKLKDIFYMLNRYTTEDIIILDPKVGDFMFSGTVNKHNIDQWFKGLSAAFPVTVTNENQRLLVALKTAPTPALKN
jgi:transmembrane sensor